METRVRHRLDRVKQYKRGWGTDFFTTKGTKDHEEEKDCSLKNYFFNEHSPSSFGAYKMIIYKKHRNKDGGERRGAIG